MFFYIKILQPIQKIVEPELITPPLNDGLILPGVLRDSVLTLAREWGEFRVYSNLLFYCLKKFFNFLN